MSLGRELPPGDTWLPSGSTRSCERLSQRLFLLGVGSRETFTEKTGQLRVERNLLTGSQQRDPCPLLAPGPLTQDAQKHGQQEQHVGGEHGHRSHADEQGEGQAMQGALHPWEGEERALSWAAPWGTRSPLALMGQRYWGYADGHRHS